MNTENGLCLIKNCISASSKIPAFQKQVTINELGTMSMHD
jgi:hypothetical protein